MRSRAAARCASQAALVSKFLTQLSPGLSHAPPIWEESLLSAAARANGGMLCARQLIVGTGDLSFSTVHRLANSSNRRRPPQPLWGVFIEHMLRRLDALGMGGLVTSPDRWSRAVTSQAARLAGTGVSAGDTPGHGAALRPNAAVLIVKHGRRALGREWYAPLQTEMHAVLGVPVTALDVARVPLRLQLSYVRRAAIGVTPDGGASFLLAFLPRGGSVVVLGTLERWLWANDGRLRTFYCQPRKQSEQSTLPCPVTDASTRPSSDCYSLTALTPCLQTMLSRAREHVRLSWPEL